MELCAALQALQYLKTPHRITLYSDSKYLKDGISTWIHGWKKRGWLTAAKQPVKNRDLWQAIDEAVQHHEVQWKWVKGHGDNEWNERADALAVAARLRVANGEISRENMPPPQEQTAPEAVHIYCAITCRPSDEVGSWVALLNYRQHYRVLGKRVQGKTGNRLHIEAAIGALKTLKRPLPVILYTTSGYLKNGAESWLQGWKQRGWKNKDGEQISNREQWQELSGLLDGLPVRFKLVDKKNTPPCHYQEAKAMAREWADEEKVDHDDY
jgi:ribonuclease HI